MTHKSFVFYSKLSVFLLTQLLLFLSDSQACWTGHQFIIGQLPYNKLIIHNEENLQAY